MSEREAVWEVGGGETTEVVTTRPARAAKRGEWGRRRWVEVGGRERAPKVALKEARAEIFCRCGELVVIGEWNGVEWCECGVCYRLACSVKMEVFE